MRLVLSRSRRLTMMFRSCVLRSLKVCEVKVPVRSSALFINGSKATETFVYVSPHIDFQEQLKQKDIILEQLSRRKSELDWSRLENLWSVYNELNLKKSEYENKKSEVSRELGKLIKAGQDNDDTKKMKIQIDLLKDNLRKLKLPLWSAEEQAVVEILKLPNTLHPKTPDGSNKEIHTHLQPPNCDKDHLKIGKALDLILFKKNENYYLKGDAAVFELGAQFYLNCLLRKEGFIQFSNPDFVKSVIVEGCGGDHTNPDSTFILHHNDKDAKVNPDSRLHLTGGASLCSFLAYHSKNVLYSKALPLKYHTMGRQYLPSLTEEDSLFNVSQASVVQVFGAVKEPTDVETMMQELIEVLNNFYTNLGHHYKLSYVSADKLQTWESLRLAVEMYSTSLKSYIEVANVSVSGDYISKRLMFTYTEDKQNKFPYLISGMMLNVPKLLACVLEQDTDFKIPTMYRVENWRI